MKIEVASLKPTDVVSLRYGGTKMVKSISPTGNSTYPHRVLFTDGRQCLYMDDGTYMEGAKNQLDLVGVGDLELGGPVT